MLGVPNLVQILRDLSHAFVLLDISLDQMVDLATVSEGHWVLQLSNINLTKYT